MNSRRELHKVRLRGLNAPSSPFPFSRRGEKGNRRAQTRNRGRGKQRPYTLPSPYEGEGTGVRLLFSSPKFGRGVGGRNSHSSSVLYTISPDGAIMVC